MTRLAPSVLPLLLAILPAQIPTDPAVLGERRDDKLAAAFLRHADWHTDLASAKRAAARDGKLILAHFTRSFVPCGTSIRCEREVLSDPEFAEFSKRAVLYCHVTAHVDAKDDQFLFACGGSGWPHHAILDATGRVLGRHPSWRKKSVAAFSELLERAQQHLDVERETSQTIAAAHRRRLDSGLAAGALSLAEARDLLAKSGPLPREATESYSRQLTDLEVLDVLTRHDRFDDASHAKVGREFWSMYRMGKRPSERNTTRDFWGGILLYLEGRDRPDVDAYAEGLAALEKTLGGARSYRKFLAERREALAKMRGTDSERDG